MIGEHVDATSARSRCRGRLMGWVPPQLLVQDSLMAAAEAAPEKVAIVDRSESFTYGSFYDGALGSPAFCRTAASSEANASRSISTTR